MTETPQRAEAAGASPSASPAAVRTIYEKSRPGRRAYSLPHTGVPEAALDELVPGVALRGRPARLPEVAEVDLVRHFTELSGRDYGVETGAYPLGSCTMKYNPKVNERVAALPGLRGLHPYEPEGLVQGALELMDTLSLWLAEIAGLARTTLQPAAGAHGELTGLLLVRAYHEDRGSDPHLVLIPDTAHGTNPASVVMAGYRPATLPSDARGGIDLAAVRGPLLAPGVGAQGAGPAELAAVFGAARRAVLASSGAVPIGRFGNRFLITLPCTTAMRPPSLKLQTETPTAAPSTVLLL